jgi:hypothetical protein
MTQSNNKPGAKDVFALAAIRGGGEPAMAALHNLISKPDLSCPHCLALIKSGQQRDPRRIDELAADLAPGDIDLSEEP